MDIRTLTLQPEPSNTLLIAVYAGDDCERWNQLRGIHFSHKKFGAGKIISASKVGNRDILVKVMFDKPFEDKSKREFTNEAFEAGFFTLMDSVTTSSILTEYKDQITKLIAKEKEIIRAEELEREVQKQRLEDERRQREKEAADRKEFSDLKSKYSVSWFTDQSPTSPLYMILLKLEGNESLDDNDLTFITKENYMPVPLAYHYEIKYQNDPSDLWSLIKACSAWREAKNPQRAIEISNASATSDKKTMSALLTTRGGAYRDLSELDSARICAKEAIRLQPKSYRSYNLLGAIYYQQGEPELADECFKKAIELGSKPKDTESEIKNSIERANPEARIRTIKYLLNKDPEKYAWATHYIDKN